MSHVIVSETARQTKGHKGRSKTHIVGHTFYS